MIEQEKVNEILKKSKEIEDKIEQKKKEAQEISNKLIELNTKKEQVIEELKKYNVTEDILSLTIEKLYKEVEDGIRKFEEISGNQN